MPTSIALPSIAVLQSTTQSLAMLDAILSPDWTYRYFSYNSHWSAGAQMASMRNGEGDDWFLLFDGAGAALKGFAHELAQASTCAKEIACQVPPAFAPFLQEPAFSMHEATFCFWRESDAAFWSQVRALPGEGGAQELLHLLTAGPKAYQQWAEHYYEITVDGDSVQAIFSHTPLSAELVASLNPDADFAQACTDADEIGYVWAAA